MNQIKGLLRETWWLWLLFYGACGMLTRYVEPGMIVTFPMLFMVMIYFAFVRFDEDGESRGS